MAFALQAGLMALALVALIAAMLSDFTSMRIPNLFSVGVALLFLPVAILADLPWQAIAIDHLATAAGILLVGILVFARGLMGGGDVKLLVAVGLWTGWKPLPEYLLLTALLGGVVALFALSLRRPPGSLLLVWLPVLRHGFGDGKNVPYGLAIGAAALWMAPRLDTFPKAWLP
ncbi:MAG: prepilin peptidase [Magnetospirillum sp. WYHS-4]